MGIIRTQLEFVHHSLINEPTAKYFKFNDNKDNLIEVTQYVIKQQVTNLLDFKNEQKFASTKTSILKKECSTLIYFTFLRKLKHIYKHDGLRSLAIKICKKICPTKLKHKLKFLYIKLGNLNYIPKNIQLLEDSISSTLFNPELIQSEKFNINFISEHSILVSIGLDWDHSNYPLLYWLKKKIGFEFVGAFYDGIPIVNHELVQSFYFSQKFFSHLYYLIHLSDKVFCISGFSKNQLEEICEQHHITKIPLLKTIHLGDSVHKKVSAKAFNDRNHKKDYVLYVSTIESRKNHILLLKLWQQLQKKNTPNLPDLVFVGMHGWGVEDLYTLYKKDKNLQKIVHFYDDVDDDELVHLYKNTKFTVFPSFAEGWGLGAVESMLYEKVCLISTCDALKEATQGLMPSLDPTDIVAWLKMIEQLISNTNVIEQYTKNIKTKFKARSWEEFSSDFTVFAKGES